MSIITVVMTGALITLLAGCDTIWGPGGPTDGDVHGTLGTPASAAAPGTKDQTPPSGATSAAPATTAPQPATPPPAGTPSTK